MAETHGPDQILLERDLDAPRIIAGSRMGKWQIVRYDFPALIVKITAAAILRPDVTFTFRCLCDNYPGLGPYVEVWDDQTRRRPNILPVISPGVIDAFKDWGAFPSGGIYRAWQRGAATHNNWALLRADEAWHRNRSIVFVLEKLHELVVEEATCMALSQAA